MKNTGTYFNMRRKKRKLKLGWIILNTALIAWCIDSIYSIYLSYKLAGIMVRAFPALGR